MAGILIFLAIVTVIVGWYLSRQRLLSKPWLEVGVIDEAYGAGGQPRRHPLDRPARLGLGLFLAVAGSLFTLLISAYLMRRQFPDWQAPPVSSLLWFNTGLLAASSLVLHVTQRLAGRGRWDDAKLGLFMAAALALLFLLGQMLVWRQMTAAGYLAAGNPGNAFLYLIIGLHGLHLGGGMVALGRNALRLWHVEDARRDRVFAGLQLCAVYWHFLLVVWLIMLALLAQWVDDVVAFCGQFLS
ncbi:cytochrome c oxidase subunit 3 [Dongia soli]|uniref:Cytochrome c oxidase subunit 3 n=1 Tax=Dongia soli TaxID=600628 RepID=A0ABU5EHG7_9PROT|nr:cytochrome c oxidase subunit 3 [Dongia soli]MDY0884930.1 cytochrome c oxidase subunit 3 [Dongia soli]